MLLNELIWIMRIISVQLPHEFPPFRESTWSLEAAECYKFKNYKTAKPFPTPSIPSSWCTRRPSFGSRRWWSLSMGKRLPDRLPRGLRSGRRWSSPRSAARRRRRTACLPTSPTKPEKIIFYLFEASFNFVFKMKAFVSSAKRRRKTHSGFN